MMRRKARVDANQPDIVKALRQVGASVTTTHQLGQGFPDLVVGFRGRNYLLEVKDGSKPPSDRRLTDDEQEFADKWAGQYAVVESVQQALTTIGARPYRFEPRETFEVM